MRRSVLVSGPDAAALAEALAARTEALDCVVAPAEATARAYLAGTAFDHVLVTGDGPAAEATEALARALGCDAHRATPDADLDALLRRLGVSTAAGAAATGTTDPDLAAAADQIRALAAALAETAHDLNNPVAVIQGNAQLARELGRELDPVLAEALADIETASRDLAERIRALGALRRAADAALAALGTG